jgi:hypothetical protein
VDVGYLLRSVTNHVWLGNDRATVKGTKLGEWVHDLLSGMHADIGP